MELNLNDKIATVRSMVRVIANRQLTEQEKNLYPIFIALKTIMMGVMDDLRDTNMYSQEIKKSGKIFYGHLKKRVEDDYCDIWLLDGKALENLEEHINKLLEVLLKCTPDMWSTISIAATMTHNNKEHVQDRLNIVVGESADFELMGKKEDIIKVIRKMDTQQVDSIRKYIDNVLIPNSKTISNEHSCSNKQLAG